RHLHTVLGVVRAAAPARHVAAHGVVHQVTLDGDGEDLVGKGHRPDLLAARVLDVHLGHRSLLAYFPVFAALAAGGRAAALSRSMRVGGTLDFSKCPRDGLFAVRPPFFSTRPTCADSYLSRSLERNWTMTHGPAAMTVTGITVPSGSKTWVMPTFLPMSPSIM